MSEVIDLPIGVWVELPVSKAAMIRHKSGRGQVVYSQSDAHPVGLSPDTPLFDESYRGEKVHIDGVRDGERVYAYAINSDCSVSVINRDSQGAPDGVYSGLRAKNFQSYDESNKKLGFQWEISREIIGATAGQRIFSVIKVGDNLPIDLKARVLGGTDEGVIGKMYWLNESDIETFGNPDRWYNFRTDISRTGAQPEVLIYPESEVTFAGGLAAVDLAIEDRQVSADAYRTTSPVAAAGGVPAAPVGGNRIIYQGEIVMLEIFSKSAQDVTSLLEVYEGGLDLPLS